MGVIYMTKSRFALCFFLVALAAPLQAVSQSATQASASSDVPHPDMLVVPACPVGGSQQFTKNLQIVYLPANPGAIKNPQSLTLRLVFNGSSWRDHDRTAPFQRKDDGSWQASVPLAFQWVYAIWYVRDELTGQRDDNRGRYWDVVFCDDKGKKLSQGIRYQAEGYAGSIFSDDIKRATDYDRAISAIEQSEAGPHGIVLYDEWVYKFRRQSEYQREHQELANEIRRGLVLHAADPDYLRQTAMFLVAFEDAFPSELVGHAVDISDRMAMPGMPSVRSELDREHAESIENPEQRAKALEEWLVKYPDDRAYSNEIRKERLDAFGDAGDIDSSEEVFRDLAVRVPDEADLYATMASIYIRRNIKLNEALILLDQAQRKLSVDGESSGFIVVLDGNPDENLATLNLWRGRAFSELRQWAKAEDYLERSARALDEAEPYALLAHAQEQQKKWRDAKNSYLEASVRSSSHEKDYREQFVRFSLKTGTPSRLGALRELAGVRKRNLDTEHYKPSLVDLPLPDFTFTTETGEKITSSSLRGKNAVLDIWATWCGACVSELGSFARFQHLHPELKLLLVGTYSKIPDIRRVFQSQGISEQIIVATDGDVARFGDNGVPQTYIVDENGRVRILHYGGLPDVASYLEADLAAMKTGSPSR
jgi:thiol-disulfide isomerase/thioredoxin/tetratricopeptide (TPR) repeat protein